MAQRESRPVRYLPSHDKRHEVPLGMFRQHSPFPPDWRSLYAYRRVGRAIMTLSDTLACFPCGYADEGYRGTTAVHVPVDSRGDRRLRRDGQTIRCPAQAQPVGLPTALLNKPSFQRRGGPHVARSTEREDIYVIRCGQIV